MAIKTYNDQNFVAIANAIRAKNGETTQYKPSEMAPAIMAIESGLELLPQDTAAGAIANFPDGSNNYPVVELIANIAPNQSGSGDPAPDNVRPISGYTGMNITRSGKNMLSSASAETNTGNGVTIVCDGEGTYTISGTATGGSANIRFSLSTPCKIPKGAYLHLKNNPWHAQSSINFERSDLTSIFSYALSPANRIIDLSNYVGEEVAYIRFYVTNESSINVTVSPMISASSAATDFEPYSAPEVKTISWESEAGTVYGGTLNVTTGELTVINARKKISDFGTWSYVTNYDGYFQAPKGDMKEAVDNFTPLDGLYCEVYKTATSSAAGSGKVNYTIASGSGAAAGLRIRNNDYSDVQSFLAAFGDYYIVYPLATPEVYQLEPEEVKTLLGVNNIYADTGDVEVTYRADIDLYIAKKIAEGA